MSNALNSALESPQAQSLEQRIDETRREVKRVDIIVTFVTMFAGTVIFLFLVVILDHWIFSSGLSAWMRVVLFAGGISALFAYLAARVIPIIRYSVNPVYAAQILETHKPSLKNSLINWILLRRERRENPDREGNILQEKMFEGVTRKAATGIAEVPREMTVDHSQVVRWAIVLLASLVLFCAYTLISPKSPLQSIYRLIFPLADIEPPQSVRFIEILPGNETVFQGDHIVISAKVANAGKENVFIYYSTDDGRLIDEAVPMSIPEGGFRYESRFPPQKTGFEESISYRIGVGKSRSQPYRIEVRPPITFDVRSVTYHYPEYTGLGKQTVYNTGDLRALEGTKAEIEAKSNINIYRAVLVPDNDDSRSRSMTVSSSDPTVAVGSLMLQRDSLRPNFPEFMTYSPKSFDSELHYNKLPSIYRVEVTKDLPPVIDWIDPKMDRAKIPVNGNLDIKAKAEDPDFGIRFVKLHIKVRNRIVPEIKLLDGPEYGKVSQMSAVLEGSIQPGKLGLEVGDEGEYWAEAIDSKIPNPNAAETMPLTFIVTDFEIGADQPKDNQPNSQPENQQPKNDDQRNQEQNQNPENNPDQPKNDQPGEQNGNNGEDNPAENGSQNGNNSQDGNKEEGENGQNGEKDGSQGDKQEQPQKRDEPMDGENDPGGVIQEALDQLKKDNPEKMKELENQAREEAGKKNQPQNKDNQPGENNQQDGNAKAGGGEGDSDNNGDQTGAGAPQAGSDGGNQDGTQSENGNSGQSETDGNQGGGGEPDQSDNPGGQKQEGDNSNPGNKNQGNPNGGEQEQSEQSVGNNGNGSEKRENNPSGNNPGQPNDDNGNQANQANQENQANQGNGAEQNTPANQGNQQQPQNGNSGNKNQNPKNNNQAGNEKRTNEGTRPDNIPETSGSADPNANPNAQSVSEGELDPSLPQDDPARGTPPKHDPSAGSRDAAPGGPEKDPLNEKSGAGGDQASQQPGSENSRNVDKGGRPGEQNGDKPGGNQSNEEGGNGGNSSPENSRNQNEGSGNDGGPGDPNKQGGTPKEGLNGNSGENGEPGGETPPGDVPSGNPSGQPGKSGGGTSQNPEGGSGAPTIDTKGDEVDRRFSELATQFVLDELEKGNQAVYDRLGWSKDEANQFLDRWKKLAVDGEDALPGTREFGDRKEFFESIGNLRPGQRTGVKKPGHGSNIETATESRKSTTPEPFRERANGYRSGIGED